MLVVTELFNIGVSESDSKESARCRRVFVVTELVVSETQCSGCYRNTKSVPQWYKIENNFVVEAYLLRVFFFILHLVNDNYFTLIFDK